ncbi:MAG: DUF342 domain-containing protein [Spirochaetales bacterium]|nr:DUF342 domain-containing protein [Spirochaetales bacterium]
MADSTVSREGTYDLFYRKGFIYLSVTSPSPGGKPVYPEEVENRMRMLEMPRIRTKLIRDIIEEAEGVPRRLAEWPGGSSLASKISCRIDKDSMAAYITVTPPKKGAFPPESEDLEEFLRDQGIRTGIDREALTSLLKEKLYDRETLCARGIPPVHSQGSKISYLFNTCRGKPYLTMDFDRINLKELNFIENVKKGDLLAEVLPPVPPRDGSDVTGKRIPADTTTENQRLSGGEHLVLDPEGTKIYAGCNGNVKLEEGKIVLEPVVTVKDVNYETGNIHVDGSVVITGGIADGFIVEATGDIQVTKGVGRAVIKAGGNVLLKTGINGNGDGSIQCGKDLYAKYIESSRISCRGNIFVEEAVMHSSVICTGNCVLNGRRSEIIAGDLIAGGSVWCKKLGNIYEVPTVVSLGVRPRFLLAHRDMKEQLETKQNTLNKVDEQIDQLLLAVKEGHREEKIQQALEQLTRKSEELLREIQQHQKELPDLRAKLLADPSCILVAEDTIYKGVIIYFGKKEFHVPDKGLRKTILKPQGTEIVESGFNRQHRPTIVFSEESQTPEIPL